jgi:simple sugar transport system substrate-binding protein
MIYLNRRRLIQIGGAAATLPLLGSRAFAQETPIKVAFVLIGTPDDNGWNYGHDLGRQAMEEAFPGQIESTVVTNVPEGPDAERVFRELAQQGHHLIFGTSFGYGDYMLRVAQQFPDVKFEWATGNQTAPNLSIYNAKFHEGRAVLGTIAGMMTESNKLAYIGSMPIPEVRMGINAFAIAARKVNPEATVQVVYMDSWFNPSREADATRALIDQGVDIITSHMDGPVTLQIAEERGIIGGFGQGADMSAFAPEAHLTAIIDIWGPHYIESARAVIEGTWEESSTWPGLAEGEVVIGDYNEKIPEDVVAAAEEVKNAIIDGSLHPFAGPINDNTGAERVAEGDIIDDGEFWAVDWYAEGVIA